MTHLDDIALTVIRTLSLQSLYSLILFPIIWVLVKCCRGKYPQWQHGLWLLILVRLVIPPDTAFTWSARNIIQSCSLKSIHSLSSTYSSASHKLLARADTLADYFSHRSLIDNSDPPEKIQIPDRRHSRIFPAFSSKNFFLFIGSLWLTISVFLSIRFLKKRHGFWKTARNGRALHNPDLLNLAEIWKKRLGINRKIILKADAANGPPFTIGLFCPVVVLPEHLLSPPQNSILNTVLAHELVHVKRWDDLFITFQELLRIVYFFNPVVWYIMPRLTWTRETICDMTVLSHGTIAPKSYARHIVAFLKSQSVTAGTARNLAGFTSAAKGMAFRLISIQKEDNMPSYPTKIYVFFILIGVFLLPMSPVVSSGQKETDQNQTGWIEPDILPKTENQIPDKIGLNPLDQYILDNIPCQNPTEVSFILWGDKISDNFQQEDFQKLAAATDFDSVDNIGNGKKAYIFYLLGSSKRGMHRPSFHFIKEQNRLLLIYKSPHVSIYLTDQPRKNGRYQIAEGWRADLFNGKHDDRIKLAWGSRTWFWTGKEYVPAYTDYSVKNAVDPSLLGTRRDWNSETRSLYEAASLD